jgi:phosphate/sulfate permease
MISILRRVISLKRIVTTRDWSSSSASCARHSLNESALRFTFLRKTRVLKLFVDGAHREHFVGGSSLITKPKERMIMGLAGMVISAMSTVAGAIMYWGVTAQSSAVVQNNGIRLSTIGVILMIAGVIGFIISALVFASSRRGISTPTQTFDRETVDSTGHKTLLHEQRN